MKFDDDHLQPTQLTIEMHVTPRYSSVVPNLSTNNSVDDLLL